jgi:hypothetical protein
MMSEPIEAIMRVVSTDATQYYDSYSTGERTPAFVEVKFASIAMPVVEMAFAAAWARRNEFQVGALYAMTLTPAAQP